MSVMGRGEDVRCGTFGALQPHPHPVQLGSGMGTQVESGECLAQEGLMGSHQEFGLYPAAFGRLSEEKRVGLRKDPCGRDFENGGRLCGPWTLRDDS